MLLLICCQAMRRYVSAISSWVARELCGARIGFVFDLIRKFAVALLTCIFALGGAAIGVISGALKGQTTETGFLRGFGVGAVAGAVTGVQLMELILNGEPFSKVALICSLVNGKIFMEWVSPAVLKAYQWQVSTMDTGLRDIPDIFEVTAIRGLSEEAIKDLPSFNISSSVTTGSPSSDASCAICLQDLMDGESARMLPSCRHFFHTHCIDEWLPLQGSCPTCREDV
ncbi:NEP1-interacting protein 2-like [Andrographis paniculata]|uniref:NEP1-interacting protein 2-like n=1 Tax=Andrographis paniculata TaxID=175694 RepID=UPI0021E77D87|nr:NEP1-interacting protein 2-like [Andrographis paniculata]